MLRLLLVIGLLFVLYFLLRQAFRQVGGKQSRLSGSHHMVQDPVCRTYVPKGSAVAASIGGQTYYFCSADCARAFQKQLSH